MVAWRVQLSTSNLLAALWRIYKCRTFSIRLFVEQMKPVLIEARNKSRVINLKCRIVVNYIVMFSYRAFRRDILSGINFRSHREWSFWKQAPADANEGTDTNSEWQIRDSSPARAKVSARISNPLAQPASMFKKLFRSEFLKRSENFCNKAHPTPQSTLIIHRWTVVCTKPHLCTINLFRLCSCIMFFDVFV